MKTCRSAPASPVLATPDSLSREPSPALEVVESEGGRMAPPPSTSSFLAVPTDYKISSKSAPGSPGIVISPDPALFANTAGQHFANKTTKVVVAHAPLIGNPSNGVLVTNEKNG